MIKLSNQFHSESNERWRWNLQCFIFSNKNATRIWRRKNGNRRVRKIISKKKLGGAVGLLMVHWALRNLSRRNSPLKRGRGKRSGAYGRKIKRGCRKKEKRWDHLCSLALWRVDRFSRTLLRAVSTGRATDLEGSFEQFRKRAEKGKKCNAGNKGKEGTIA